MKRFQVSAALAQNRQAFSQLKQRVLPAAARALNRSIGSGRTFMTRSIASDTGLKQATVREQIREKKATQTDLVAQLSITGKRIPLIDFGARGPEPSRGRGRGVTARLPGGKGRYPNAFIATMRSGHRGVYQRGVRARLPIYELFGPSLPKVFAKYAGAGLAHAQSVLNKNMEHEFAFAATQ